MRRSTTVRITAAKPSVQSSFRLRSQSVQAVACALPQKSSAEEAKGADKHVSHLPQQ